MSRDLWKRSHGLARQFGFDAVSLGRSVKGLPAFLKDYLEFQRQLAKTPSGFKLGALYPALQDRRAAAGTVSTHYFSQDLLVAQKIFANRPVKHVDVGSRIDGFVAHVAAFRQVEVLDIRQMSNGIRNVTFRQSDITGEGFDLSEYCDSVSSLHAVEHFGLGRYGDRVDVNGHLKGLDNIYRMLQPGGKFYFSVPIGRQRVEFNAHRVFSLQYLVQLLQDRYRIDSFSYVDDRGHLTRDASLSPENIKNNCRCHYGCGIFELTKMTDAA